MHPNHQQHGGLLDRGPDVEGDLDGDDIEVAVFQAIDCVGKPGAENMKRRQRYDGDTQQVARRLHRRHGQALAHKDRIEGESQMNQQRPIEQHRHRPAAPERDEDGAAGLQGVEGDQAQRQVQQMGQDKPEEDQTADEPQAPDHCLPLKNPTESHRPACDATPGFPDSQS